MNANLFKHFRFFEWHNSISCNREIPTLSQLRQIHNVPAPSEGDCVSYVGFNEVFESLIYIRYSLRLEVTQLFLESYSKLPYMRQNLLIWGEGSQRSYLPCSLCSAPVWLPVLLLMCLDQLLNFAACCPREDPNKKLKEQFLRERPMAVVGTEQSRAEPLRMVTSWKTAGHCKWVSGYSPNYVWLFISSPIHKESS